jgi:hypothetical protein
VAYYIPHKGFLIPAMEPTYGLLWDAQEILTDGEFDLATTTFAIPDDALLTEDGDVLATEKRDVLVADFIEFDPLTEMEWYSAFSAEDEQWTDQPAVAHTSSEGLRLPGVAGNYASVPNSAPLQITGPLTIVVRAGLSYWSGSNGGWRSLVGKWKSTGPNEGSYRLQCLDTNGILRLDTTSDGGSSAPAPSVSTAPVPFSDGEVGWVAGTINPNDGGNRVIKFWTSLDGVVWEQLGSTVTSPAVTIYNSTSSVEIGGRAGAITEPDGTLSVARIYSGSDFTTAGPQGTLVLDVDFRRPRTPTFTAATGQTVTVHSGAAVPAWRNAGTLRTSGARLTDDGLVLPGVAQNFATTPVSSALQITGDLTLVARAALTSWTPGAGNCLLARRVDAGNQQSWSLVTGTTGVLSLRWSPNGSGPVVTANSTAATGFTDGALGWVAVTLDVDNGAVGNDVKFWTSTDGITWAQLGTTVTTAGVTSIHAGTAPLEIGTRNIGVNDPLDGTVSVARIYSGSGFTTAGPSGTLVFDADFRTAPGDTSFTAATGQTVTVRSTFDGRQASASFQPTLRGSTAVLNNRPTVQFDGTDDRLEILTGVSLAQPFSVVWIGSHGVVGSNRRIAGFNSAGTGQAVGLTSTPNWSAQMGSTALTGGTPVANTGYMARFLINDASSVIAVNGSAVATGTVNGTLSVDQIILGAGRTAPSSYAQFLQGHTAFLGIYPGDITADPDWQKFKDWAALHYGITIV